MSPSPVDEAIESRRSIRQFLPSPVAHALVLEILNVASRAPSGHNTQPWKVHAVTGRTQARLSEAILAAFNDPAAVGLHTAEFDSYPSEWVSPYIDRRRKVGRDMYTLLGIPRGDASRIHEQVGQNFVFFGAPLGFIFTIDRLMVPGSAMDLGMFLQTMMIAARARGLDTCMQAAFALFHRVIVEVLGIPSDQVVMGGMSMGYADRSAIVNQVVTEREPAVGFTRFHD